MNNLNNIKNTSVGKLLLKLSLPSVAGLLSNAFYMIINGIYLGQFVGEDALAAATIIFPIQMILFSFALLFASGGGILFSISLGKKDIEKTKKIITSTIFFGIITFLFVSFFMSIIIDNMIILFGCKGKTFIYGKIYLLTLLPFFVFQGMMLIYENFLRAKGNSIFPMIAMIFSSFINLILGFIFIPVLKKGIFGAGLATGIAQLLGFLFLYFFIKIKKYNINIIFSNMFICLKTAKEIISSGFSSFSNQIAFSLRALILNIITIYLGGENALVMVGIITRVDSFVVIPVFGITHGLRPIVGYAYGSKLYERIKKCLILSLFISFIFLIIMFFLIFFFPIYIMKIFVKDLKLINYGSIVLILTHLGLPFIGFNIIGSMFMQSIKKNKAAFIFSIINPLFIFIPLILFVAKITKNIWFIWIVYSISDFVSFLFMSLALLFLIKKLKKEIFS